MSRTFLDPRSPKGARGVDGVIDFFEPWSVEVRGRPGGEVAAEGRAHEAVAATTLEQSIDRTALQRVAAPPTPTRGARSRWAAREARAGARFPSAVLTPPAQLADEVPSPGEARSAPEDESGPVTIFRNVVVGEILAVSARLESAKHRTALQDLLDLEEPALRMLVWPCPGLLVPPGPRLQATIEFVVERGDSCSVAIRHWFGPAGGAPIVQARLPLTELDHFRVRAEIIDFLRKVLDRA